MIELLRKMKKGKERKKIKALALFSGGLDSSLAVKLILDQGIEVIALNFTSPFCLCSSSGCSTVNIAKKFEIPIKVVRKGEDYLRIIKKPKYGYGKNMNPCIDCRIYIFKKAKEIAKEIGANFIFTGEVLGERPMSQHMRAFKIIEKESGLEGKILRPLSAKLLPETEAEKKGLVDREKLLDIRGRSRKKQIELADKYEIDYPCPAGGCLLTYKGFADKVRDLFEHKEKVSIKDIQLLKIGRHFRYKESKIIVGRNEEENKKLLNMKEAEDYCFEVPNYGSPITILQGRKSKKAIEIAARITLRYSDAKNKEEEVIVKYGREEMDKEIKVKSIEDSELEKLRVVNLKKIKRSKHHNF
jgi:tRNA U34 2-thiouridine synthase MnmA/TrmU